VAGFDCDLVNIQKEALREELFETKQIVLNFLPFLAITPKLM
jgi:hypothetical protein